MSNAGFQDHFGPQANAYRQFRPNYPAQLFEALAAACDGHELAWDCATGSGQAALPLARFYESVLATDASAKQLHNVAHADAVYFVQAPAEAPCLKPASVDLLVVAQALHWFRLPTFFAVAKSVLKRDGVFAAWTYNLVTVDDAIDPLLNHFYHNTLGAYWPAERGLVESGYADIAIPFDTLELGEFAMTAKWNQEELCGYLSTWSAVQHYKEDTSNDPLPDLRAQLIHVWGDKNETREVSWPLSIKAGISR
ncbi:MAG: class I SAM-dependent methyltransferase [Pseudomonadales bacterium]